MKKLAFQIRLILLVLLTSILACEGDSGKQKELPLIQAMGFEVSMDSFKFSSEGQLRKVMLVNDHYYGMFEKEGSPDKPRFKRMLAFDQDMAFVEEVAVPEEIQETWHYNLYVNGDSLIGVSEDLEKKTCYDLDNAWIAWVPNRKGLPKYYEDEDYEVYSLCKGEFGGAVIFKSKKTGASFEAQAACAEVINRIGETYYLTIHGGSSHVSLIYAIPDPSKMQPYDPALNGMTGSYAQEGLELYYGSYDFDKLISFVAEGELYQFFSSGSFSGLGKVVEGKLEFIGKLGFGFVPRFCQHLDQGKLLLSGDFPQSKKSGMLIIDGKHFRFFQQP